MTATRRELFVYYRVHREAVSRAGPIVVAFQHELMDRTPGLVARLLRKGETDSDATTWMETYAVDGATSGVEVTLQAEIEAFTGALVEHIDGVRHVEVFLADD